MHITRAVVPTEKFRSIWRFEFAGKKIVVGISRVTEPIRLLHRLNSFRPRRQVLSLLCGLGCLGVQILTRGPIRLLHGRASSYQKRFKPGRQKGSDSLEPERERTALLSLHVPLGEASLAHAIGVERVGHTNAGAQQHAQSRDCFGHRLTPWYAMPGRAVFMKWREIALMARGHMI